jgi:hypothetical protein
MKTEFIKFFVDIAQQKLKLKYSIVKMILHTLPHIKSGWKEFKQETGLLPETSEEKYPGIEVIEHLFVCFIECGNITREEMVMIMDVHKTIDLRSLKREYAYTEEELRYYLRSRLMNRMVSKLNASVDARHLVPDDTAALFEVS